MTRGSSLSDEKIIEALNANFVSVIINVTDDGFPKDLPALGLWKKAYTKDPMNKFSFSTAVAIHSRGRTPLGTTGCGHTWEWNTSINYLPGKFLSFLKESRTRNARLRKLLEKKNQDVATKAAGLHQLKEAILYQIQEANRCERPRR